MKKIIISFFILLPILVSCEKDEESTVIINIDNYFEYGYCKPGDLLNFEISSFTNNSYIDNLRISSSDIENGTKQLLDTILGKNNVKLDFTYKVPAFKNDSIRLTLNFTSTDNKNISQSTSKLLIVSGSKLLEEYSGIKLYSGGNHREDVLCLNDLKKAYDFDTADSALIDIYSYYDKTIHNNSLSKEWRTNTDVEFIKSNNFDYPSATTSSIIQTFENSRKSSSIKEIKAGDIIIIGKEGKAWGVFHIVSINDEEGTNNDFYLINYKKI